MGDVPAALLVVAGVFSLGLGAIHLVIPRLFDFPAAIGEDGPASPPLVRRALGPWTYQVRRRDVLGLSWVMSNAASYVLLSVGLVDLGWAAGWRGLPIVGVALWIAGWWALRSGSQLVVGRRGVDLAFGAWFATLAVLHLAFGLGWVVA
jgi:hypothetical protein